MHGDEIEADLARFYRLDLLDFYRGTISARKLGVLVRQLPWDSQLSIALNGGEAPWQPLHHLIADLFTVWAKQDHPRRAAKAEEARRAKKLAKVIRLRDVYEKKKRAYGLG